MLELTGRSTTGRQGFAKATAAMPPIPADGLRDRLPAGISLSMIFGTSALSHCHKTKVPLLMCLAFVSLYRLTERIHE
jgi:hypothetical protein